MSDVTLDISKNPMEVHKRCREMENYINRHCEKTQTGGRLKKSKYLNKDDNFCFIYGDGLTI